MIQFLMNAIHRLITMQGSLENRRVAIDVCEMVIKWEQLRLKNVIFVCLIIYAYWFFLEDFGKSFRGFLAFVLCSKRRLLHLAKEVLNM